VKHGDYAWSVLAAGVLGYEISAPRGELLSEACDRYRRRHPFITNAVIFYVAMHLMRAIPQRVDPLTQIAVRLR
jgi:hypothetical protein